MVSQLRTRMREPGGTKSKMRGRNLVSANVPRVTIVVHGKPWAVRPGEPQAVRDAYDRLLAERGELWTGDSQAAGVADCGEAR